MTINFCYVFVVKHLISFRLFLFGYLVSYYPNTDFLQAPSGSSWWAIPSSLAHLRAPLYVDHLLLNISSCPSFLIVITPFPLVNNPEFPQTHLWSSWQSIPACPCDHQIMSIIMVYHFFSFRLFLIGHPVSYCPKYWFSPSAFRKQLTGHSIQSSTSGSTTVCGSSSIWCS